METAETCCRCCEPTLSAYNLTERARTNLFDHGHKFDCLCNLDHITGPTDKVESEGVWMMSHIHPETLVPALDGAPPLQLRNRRVGELAFPKLGHIMPLCPGHYPQGHPRSQGGMCGGNSGGTRSNRLGNNLQHA